MYESVCQEILNEVNKNWNGISEKMGFGLLKKFKFVDLSYRLVGSRFIYEVVLDLNGVLIKMVKHEADESLDECLWEAVGVEFSRQMHQTTKSSTVFDMLLSFKMHITEDILGDNLLEWLESYSRNWQSPSIKDPFNIILSEMDLPNYIIEFMIERDKNEFKETEELLNGNMNSCIEKDKLGGLRITLASGHILNVPANYSIETPEDLPRNVASVLIEFDPNELLSNETNLESEMNWINVPGIRVSKMRIHNEEYERKCKRCDNIVGVSQVEGYKYDCQSCDEDLYEFETYTTTP